VENLGVAIYENTPAIDWQARCAPRWRASAATGGAGRGGYAASLPPLGRHQLPVQSLLVATEPLPESTWEQIGLSQGQAFSENSRQVTYGQRSADNRLVFGARGGYRFGGRLREDFTLDRQRSRTASLPVRRAVPAAQARAHHPFLGRQPGHGAALPPHMLCDRQRGIALSGGYGGEGVGATNLGGRTLAALILGQHNALTAQPWVHDNRPLASLASWPPSPAAGSATTRSSRVSSTRTGPSPTRPAPPGGALASGLADFMEGFMH
jgi:glycine/D-amino acid oxidase-like deaminating enzyme